MKRSSYRDRDYAFGQAMLTLRTAIGLTQIGLADYLHVSRRAVGEWEAGNSYPKVENIKQLIELSIKQRAFPSGYEAESVRELWRVSQQKVLLDERWLAGLIATLQNMKTSNNVSAQPQAIENLGKSVERQAANNLPFQPTSFIGRGNELSEIMRLLRDPTCRLLTLLGPGGMGKTRLALEVAASQSETFRDGVAFVALASVNSPNQIVSAVGEAIRLSFVGQSDPTASLLAYLRERHMLLLLDNFEHLLEGANLVAEIVRHAPNITILVTSRERLNLRVEWLFDVGGLSYPAGDSQVINQSPSRAELAAYSAVQLFLQRVTQVQGGVPPPEKSLENVIRICQHLAGMPLAIELAAAGVRSLSIEEIEQQIRTNLDVLTTSFRDVPARHRSLRAVFDQSWNLLYEPERTLLSRLAVFRGSCTAQAVEDVTGANLLSLTKLVDKSLIRQSNVQVQANETVEVRFFLLEPIREYALEKLAERGETNKLQQAHSMYYLQLAEVAASQWGNPVVDLWVGQFRRELDNMRGALQWACESGSAMAGLPLAEALWKFWRSYGYISEGRTWLEQLLALDGNNADPVTLSARRRALDAAAWLASDQHDYVRARQLFEQSIALRRTLGEAESETDLLLNAAREARTQGHYHKAVDLLENALARHRTLDDRSNMANIDQELSLSQFGLVLRELGLVLREKGEYARATALFEEGLQLHQTMGDRAGVALALLGLADVARDKGDTVQSREHGEASLVILRELDMSWAIGFTLNTLAQAEYMEGDLVHASALIGESVSLFRGLQADGSLAEVLITQANILRAQGYPVAASDSLREALRIAWVVGPRVLIVAALQGLAEMATLQEQTPLAVRLLNAASVMRDQMGTPIRPVDERAVSYIQNNVQAILGTTQFSNIWLEAQKMSLEQILTESPFSGLLPQSNQLLTIKSSEQAPLSNSAPALLTSTSKRRLVDWDDALTIPSFYGRDWELNVLTEWVIDERCQIVSILGMGGIGKSALAVNLMHQVVEDFEVVIWRSLRDLPTSEALLEEILQILAPEIFGDTTVTFDRRMSILLDQMQTTRILLVLDNLESVLEEGEGQGRMRPEYKSFAQFLRLSAQTKHQSCLLLTSREKPSDLIAQEGNKSLVRSLRLARLDTNACESLLVEKGVTGTSPEWARLIDVYTGNPLALKIVAQTIVDLFDGAISPFLEQGEVIFGGVRALLSEQFERLSSLEQTILLWLTIMREPTTLEELLTVLVMPALRVRLIEAIQSLHRRSLIERGKKPGSFTLQSVVLEYLTARLIADAADEIHSGRLSRLIEYSLEIAHSKDYIRESQNRLLAAPLLAFLSQKNIDVKLQILTLLDEIRALPYDAQGYAPANLLALLRLQQGHLRKLDLSRLSLRGVYLQGVEMQDTTLSGSRIQGSIFTATFDAVMSVAISSGGRYWAAASRSGEVWLWGEEGVILQRVWRAHVETIPTIAFSPDERTLATGSWDGSLKLWDLENGLLLWSGRHASLVKCVVFSPDGTTLASSGNDGIVQMWDVKTGTRLAALSHTTPVPAVVWNLDGSLIVTGDRDGVIRVWEFQEDGTATILRTLLGHTNWVDGLALSPDGSTLCSVGWDGIVRLWEFATGRLLDTLTVHSDWVQRVAWSPDGHTLATCSRDHSVCLWSAEQGGYQMSLLRHASNVVGLAFTSDNQKLISGSEDGTLRVWDIADGHCTRVVQGYADSLYAIDWSPDGRQLVSGGTDTLVTIHMVTEEEPPRILHGHIESVFGVGWSADGRWLASSGWNKAIHLWETTWETEGQLLYHPDDTGNVFYSLAWSPNGTRLACGTNRRGVQVFEMAGQKQPWAADQVSAWIRQVDWHPNGTLLSGGGEDGIVYIWGAATGTLVRTLEGHHNMVTSIAWSPDGTHLASASSGIDGGELFVWNSERWERVHSFEGYPWIVYSLAWSPSGDLLVSGGSDGMLRWWDIQRGECVLVYQAHQGTVWSLRRSPDGTQLASCGDDGVIKLWNLHTGEYLKTLRRDRPYERLNITGIQGLSEAQKVTLRTLGAIENASRGY